VTNGTLSIPFQQENNIYTIYLEEDAEKVEFQYQLEDDESTIEIIDNEYQSGRENVMMMKVTSKNGLESQHYTFYLEKEKDQASSFLTDQFTALNIPAQKQSPLLAPCVILGCVAIILVLFYILIFRFLKKKKE